MNRVFVPNRVRTFNFQREAWNPLDILLIVVLVHVARRARVLSRHASHERDRHVSLEALMHRRPVQQQRAASLLEIRDLSLVLQHLQLLHLQLDAARKPDLRLTPSPLAHHCRHHRHSPSRVLHVQNALNQLALAHA